MNCENCDNWKHGRGKPACLKCPKYRDIINKSCKRRTIKISPTPQNILEAIADDSDKIESVMQAIRLLPPELSIIVSLLYVAGLTTRELSNLLHISQSAVIRKNKFAIEIIKESLKN